MIIAQRGWKITLSAFLGGLVLGIVARLWIRWISTDPEFSWSGTIFIVLGFAIFTTNQATVFVLRKKTKSRRITSIIRGAGILFSLPIFAAAGAIMFPTVALASIAVWQKKMDRKVRLALLAISFIIPIMQIWGFISDFGFNFVTLGRALLFIAIYSAVIYIVKPTVAPFESADSIAKISHRRRNILVAIFVVLITLLFLFFTVGIPGK